MTAAEIVETADLIEKGFTIADVERMRYARWMVANGRLTDKAPSKLGLWDTIDNEGTSA